MEVIAFVRMFVRVHRSVLVRVPMNVRLMPVGPAQSPGRIDQPECDQEPSGEIAAVGFDGFNAGDG
jgi:hypothetical protein